MVRCTVPSVHSGSWGKAERGGLAWSRRTDGRLLRLRCVLGLLGQGQAARREAGSAMRLGEEASGSPTWEELPQKPVNSPSPEVCKSGPGSS